MRARGSKKGVRTGWIEDLDSARAVDQLALAIGLAVLGERGAFIRVKHLRGRGTKGWL